MGLGNPVRENWVSAKLKKEYRIGVLLPGFEDKYWITANYGIINYAKELGVKVKLYTIMKWVTNQANVLLKRRQEKTLKLHFFLGQKVLGGLRIHLMDLKMPYQN